MSPMKDVELANPADLVKLMRSGSKRHRGGKQPGALPTNTGRSRAEENARWERIFKEKFEDPTYYSRSTIRSAGSSLGGTIGADLRGASLGVGVATGPERDRWRMAMQGSARAGIAKREKQNAA